MNEKRENILIKAWNLFLENGFRSVSVEDIARATSSSKKELYELFTNKENIIFEALDFDFDLLKQSIDQYHNNSVNAIEAFVETNKFSMMQYAKINPVAFYDLEKYYPTIDKYQWEKREQICLDFIRRNIERGRKEQIYREDFNIEIASKLWFEKILLTKNHEKFPYTEFSFQTLLSELSNFQLRGIVNANGAALISKYLKDEEE